MVLVFAVSPACGVEVIRNGSFDQILNQWGIPASLGTGIPYSVQYGGANLNPTIKGLPFSSIFTGTVVFQPLNVPVVPGNSLVVSVDLLASDTPPSGKTVGVTLSYLDTNSELQRVLVLNPDNADFVAGEWKTVSISHVVPEGMAKLVEIAIDKLASGQFYADQVSVSSPTAGGTVPELGTVSPSEVAYGGTVVVMGSNLGTTPGTVTLGGQTDGVQIQSWTSQRIELVIQDPCTGGALEIDAGGIRNWQSRQVAVSSPYYAVATEPATTTAVAGQAVQVAVFFDPFNGFTSNAGVTFSVPGQEARAQFSINPVTGQGGTLLTFDTTGLAVGVHTFTVLASDAPLSSREATFQVDVREIASVQIHYIGEDYVSQPLDGAHFTAQGGFNLFYTVTDTGGQEITSLIPRPLTTSSSPFAIDIFTGSSAPWAQNALLVNGTGVATLTATTVDGKTWTSNTTATIPESPSFTTTAFEKETMFNSANETNYFYYQTSGPMTATSWGVESLMNVELLGGTWGEDNASYTGNFRFTGIVEPGDYLFNASATVGGNLTIRRVLRVVNASGYGMLGGTVKSRGTFEDFTMGNMEFYDSVSGDLIDSRSVSSFGKNYSVSRIPPGSYKLRWVPSANTPQWFPNANNFAEAGVVVVTADEIVEGVDFFTTAPTAAPAQIIGQPTLAPASTVFTIDFQGVSGVNYDLRKSTNLSLENTWYSVGSVYGYNDPATLQDTSATGTKGFYQILSNP